ncbi:hypothetical protein Tco_0883036, partial [Tanacetum coccineum]
MAYQEQQQTTEELVPVDAQVPIGASNSRIFHDAYHKEPMLWLAIKILNHQPILNALTLTTTVLLIYIQQLWNTVTFNKDTKNFDFTIDQQKLMLDLEQVNKEADETLDELKRQKLKQVATITPEEEKIDMYRAMNDTRTSDDEKELMNQIEMIIRREGELMDFMFVPGVPETLKNKKEIEHLKELAVHMEDLATTLIQSTTHSTTITITTTTTKTLKSNSQKKKQVSRLVPKAKRKKIIYVQQQIQALQAQVQKLHEDKQEVDAFMSVDIVDTIKETIQGHVINEVKNQLQAFVPKQ